MLNDKAAKAGEGSEGLSFRDVLEECLPGAVLVIDPQKRISGLDPEAERLFGIARADLLRQSIDALPGSVRDAIELAFHEGKSQAREIRLPRPDGGELAIHLAISILPPQKGDDFGVVAVLHDLTAATSMEQHIEHLSCLASIGTLSASMAHEIKNALVAVRTFLDLLIQQNKDADLANVVSREVRRIDSIVSQMLRIAGPAKPTFATLHLHDVLNHSLRLIEHQLAGKKIRLQKSLSASPDWVRGD